MVGRAGKTCAGRRLHYGGTLLLLLAPGVASAQSVADFYKGRTINLIVGTPAGGGYDVFARLIGPHLGEHVPGNPKVVVQNMPGAGGLTAAGYIFNSARKDGTEIGTISSSTLLEPLFGAKQAHFDAAQFSWLGSASQTVAFCGVGPSSRVASFNEWLESGRTLTFAASGVGATSYHHPLVMKNVLGANLKIITGYSGAGNFILALERGEVDGFCSMESTSIASQYKPVLDAGKMKLIIQMGPHKDLTYGDIPSVFDYAKTDEQRHILSIAFDQLALGRPYMAPPGIPRDRYDALNQAFAATLRDAAFLSEAGRMKLSIDYLDGEKAKKMLEQFASYPDDLLRKAKAVLAD